MKKIALIGNMNNNFYALTRYLRDAGYDAHLFYRLAMEHFQPKADSYDDEYVGFCHEVDWLDKGFHNTDFEAVKKQLDGFDFYIGQGEEAAVAYCAGYRMNVYYPYGSDVYKYAHLPQEYKWKSKVAALVAPGPSRPTYKQMQKGTMAKYLKEAIVNAQYIFADATNEEYQDKIESLHYKGEFRNVGLPFLYQPEYEKLLNVDIPDLKYDAEIRELRGKYDFMVLYHGRQEWATYHNQFTGKNTDHLIRGFASYIKNDHNNNACLVMLEYGTDVEASKNLIKELEITDNVYWFPKMYRKELMNIIKHVDVCSGEFAHSFLVFGTVMEAMMMKKPVITYRNDNLYKDIYPELYPCFNARTAEAIATALSEAANHPGKAREIGEKAHKWVQDYFINKPLKELIQVIERHAS